MGKVVNNLNVAVVVPLPLGGEAVVEAGKVLKTSDEHAQALLEQPLNWQPVKEAKSSVVKEEKVEDK